MRCALMMVILFGSLALNAGCSPFGRAGEAAAPPVDSCGPSEDLWGVGFGDLVPPSLQMVARAEPRCVRLTVLDKPQPFDVYFTWLAYDRHGREGLTYSAAALFVWNGKEVGRGDRGFEEILRRMRLLPRGSRILVYPYFLEPETGPGMSSPSDDLFGLPFDWEGMAPIVVERDLRVIWSPFDHQGRILPQFVGDWHYRWTDCKDCDASITWKNYDGFGNPGEAIYVWNGREVGKGLDGFVEVLSHLDRMKPGSKVVIFPQYVNPRRIPPDQAERLVPYDEFWELLDEVVYRRNLIVFLPEERDPGPNNVQDAGVAEDGRP